jgi:galactokinase
MRELRGQFGDAGGTLAERAVRGFERRFEREAEAVAAAPGRVNLIGDHTDYNGGFVLPMAIDRYTAVAGAVRTDRAIRVGSTRTGEVVTLADDETDADWTRYVRGVVELCRETGLDAGGLDLWIESSVPTGSGLSSSAALCVGIATLIETLAGRTLGAMKKAELCQRAEHEYAGVPCGIMDQAVIAGADPGSAMLLDCRSLSSERVEIDESKVAVLVADTRQARTLAGSAYADRRAACAAAARRLGVDSLRDVGDEPGGEAEVMRCARHVVTENARVQTFAEAVRAGRWAEAGAIMQASHASLRDDFRITGEALDAMVVCAQSIDGVYGARMTGGGMGGCAVVLARRDRAEGVSRELATAYASRTGRTGEVFAVRAVGGAVGGLLRR